MVVCCRALLVQLDVEALWPYYQVRGQCVDGDILGLGVVISALSACVEHGGPDAAVCCGMWQSLIDKYFPDPVLRW